ncbi:ribosome biogenesis GTPase Der [bacterium]|nr:ribosome biogenesis GTPase Der [bacterium]
MRDHQHHEDTSTFDERRPHGHGPLPTLAIVGRPNVGKSTMFNRIIGRRKAVVHDRPGVTRDRNFEVANHGGLDFLVVDTGGYDTKLDDPLLAGVFEQIQLAIDEADAILLLLAVDEPDHPADAEIIERLRGVEKPFFVAVNKCDSRARELEIAEFYKFGFDQIYPVAALHGVGIADLLDDVVGVLKNVEPIGARQAPEGSIALAVVGRQNVGKSTLINQLSGETRVIAAPLPGTTRDSVDSNVLSPAGKPFTLIDTAGIRRRGKIERGIERLSVTSALMSLRRADVAALVIDAAAGLTEQDAHIAGFCIEEGIATMLLLNKWDIVEKDHRTADVFMKKLRDEWGFINYAPILTISGLTGQRVVKIFDMAERIDANARRRIGTHELNKRLEEWVGSRPPTTSHAKMPKVRFMTQTGTQPPTFTMFVNDPDCFHFSYRRYIMNRLREAYDFEGVPVKLNLRRNAPRAGDLQINPKS